MAKVKSAGLRNYVGKLGGNVYYMNKGQNIGRELAPSVTNPRTPAQMRQRLKWANIVNVYKANKDWMGHLSFESKPQTWSDYNAFISANINSNPVYVTKSFAEHGATILAPYTMTRGTLPPITYNAMAGGGFDTLLRVGSLEINDNTTVGDFATAIIQNNNGWQAGDQLSVVLMYVDRLYNPIVCPIEIILDTSDNTKLSDIEYQFADLTDLLVIEDSYIIVDTTAGVSTLYQALCMVHSRTVDGKTYVSTQAFGLSNEALYLFNEAGTDLAFADAYDSYGRGEQYFLATTEREIAPGQQGVRSVVYAGTPAADWSDITWNQPSFPVQIVVIMALPLFGAVSLRVGGVSLQPSVLGRQVHAFVTEAQATSIAAATSANQKIVVTDGTETYEWG